MTTELRRIADELSSLAESTLRKAKTKGAEEAEVFASNMETLNINMKTGSIETSKGTSLGIGVRVVLGRKVGFAATTSTEETEATRTVDEALEVARIRPLDPKFSHLPEPLSVHTNDGIIDEKVLALTEKDALEAIGRLSNEAMQQDKRVRAILGGIGVQKGAYAVTNTRGVDSNSVGAGIGGGIYVVAAENGKQKTGLEELSSRRLVDFGDIGSKAAQRAIKMLESKPLGKSLKTTVVWENMSIASLLHTMFLTASSARNVQEGKSFFQGKTDQKVASEIFTLVDDGQLPEGLATAKVDTEGMPSKTTPLVEKGVLKGYLYDTYAAFQEGKQSTGNAVRPWPEPFLHTPNVRPTNLVLTPGNKNLEGLVGQVSEGILVTGFVMGVGHSNTITGEFSVVTPNAYWIQNGQTDHPLESATIAGNFFRSLKNVSAIGSDPMITDAGSIPSVVIQDLTVSG